MSLKALALSLAVTLTAATAVYSLTNRIAIDHETPQICVLSDSTAGQDFKTCMAPPAEHQKSG
ncbi:hypothetical protein [Litoreibacter halocynthiae]|uniref:hypothetical protein n=1 Tax=Litoreibacter halocynthiae TaxID=1242689 RepID=UPI0024932DCF|nr:hypothetical protein [Litoreibacter halocynthiae]